MRATAIIPVKRFAAAKQRLAAAVGPELRRALAQAMLHDVLAATARSRWIDQVIVVTGEAEAEQAARTNGAEVVGDPRDTGHARAATLGVVRALDLGAEAAALLPGDCPLLDAGELDAALDRVSNGRVAIVPDRHGTGTNALLLAPPDAITPAFGGGSRERHEQLARAAGHEVAIESLESLALDVDTPDDLTALRRVLADASGRAPHTAAALGTTHERPIRA
jgi:2-phospho-L-lactate/phosphoenolpyruvate guanylyltransferase